MSVPKAQVNTNS